MKKILLIFILIFSFVFNAKAQFPLTQTLGSPNTQVYSKGGLGADSGFVFRMNFPDTSVLNLGFLKNIPGLQIRVGDNIWMRNNAATKWVQVGSSAMAWNGLSAYNDSIRLGGIVDSGAVLKVNYQEITGAKNSKILITNDTIISPYYYNNYNQSGNLAGNLFEVISVWRENRGDTLNLQYGGVTKTLYDKFFDSISTRFGAGKTPIGLHNLGQYAQSRFYPPRDSVDVLTSSFGATGSLFAAQFGMGDSYGYNIRIAPAGTDNPNMGLSVNKSEIDFMRVIDNTRRKKMTGDGISSYMSNWKFFQGTMNNSTPKVASYLSKVIGFQSYGGTYTKSGGVLIKDSIFKVAMVDSSIAFLAEPQYRLTNEVMNGFGFVSLGDSDYNYMAGKLRLGGIMPTKQNGGMPFNFEVGGQSSMNGVRFDSVLTVKDIDSLFNGSNIITINNRGAAIPIDVNRYATNYSKYNPIPEAVIRANGGFSGTPSSTNILVPYKSLFGRMIYNFNKNADSSANTTVTLNSIANFYGTGVSGSITSGSRNTITTDTLKIVSPKTVFGISGVTSHLDFSPNLNANTKHLGNWIFFTSHFDNSNVRGMIENLIGYYLPAPETTVPNKTKIQNLYGLYTNEFKYNDDVARAWPIYINAPLSYNYFAGNVMIGDTTVSELGDNELYINGSIRIKDGTQSNGYVLTSDANGNASWQAAGGGATEYFARNDARNNTGNSLYFSNAGLGGTLDSLSSDTNEFIMLGSRSNGSIAISMVDNTITLFSAQTSPNSNGQIQITEDNISISRNTGIISTSIDITDSIRLNQPYNSSDTTIYKPLAVDSVGNSVRMNYWPTGSGGTTPGIDDVLAIGQSLTANRSINQNTHNLFFLGGGYFRVYDAPGTNRLLEIDESGTTGFIGNGSGLKQFSFTSDSLFLIGLGQKIDTTIWKPTVRNVNTGALAYAPWMYAGGSGSGAISSLLAATATNTINNADYQQEWQWNTLSSNSALKLSTNSTAAASNTQRMIEIAMTGTNSTSTQITTGIDVSNAHAGTNAINIGVKSTVINSSTTNSFPFWAETTEGNEAMHYYLKGNGGNRAAWIGLGSSDYMIFKNVHSSNANAGFQWKNRTGAILGTLALNTGLVLNAAWTTGGALSVGGSTTPTAGSSGGMSILGGAITEAASGTHSLLYNVYLAAPIITGGAATVTNTANLFVSGPTSTTVTGGNYSVWVDDGTTRLDGGLNLNIRTVTGSITAAEDFTILCDATSGGITINLPAASTVTGRIYNVKKIDNSVNTVTIDPDSTETIDGAATNVISTQWTNIQFQSNGTNWFIL